MMRRKLFLFGLLASIESAIALLFILLIPRDSKNVWWLGYSLSRLSLIFVVVCIAIASIWFTNALRKNSLWGSRFIDLTNKILDNKLLLSVLSICSFVILLLGIFFIPTWIFLPEEFGYKAYLTRFAPIILLVSAMSAQLVWLLKSEMTATLIRISYKIGCFLIVLAIGFNYFTQMVREINQVLSGPESEYYLSADSQHYYQIAEEFSNFDFKMEYVREGRAHRQPLYPLLLAIPLRLIGSEIFYLVLVNVIIAIILLFVVYFSISRILKSILAGLFAVLFIVFDEYLFSVITTSLMTEPLFILLAFATNVLFILYVVKKKDIYLFGVALFAGLTYLTRTNGLFMILVCVFVLLSYDLYEALRQGNGRKHHFQELAKKYTIATIILVLITSPSWLPRVTYHGNPFYHEYLSNYMWVDTFEEGHVFGPPRYSMQDYVSNHTLKDVISRIGHGMSSVYLDSMVRSRWPLSALVVLGLAFGILSKKPQYILLTLFMFIQLIPIVWTDLSNPTERIPWSSLFPFVVIYFALFFSTSIDALKRARTRTMEGLGNME